MNCGKTFCQTSTMPYRSAVAVTSVVSALNVHHVDLSHSLDICTLLVAESRHFLACSIMIQLWLRSFTRLSAFGALLKSPTVTQHRSEAFPTSSLSVYTLGTFETTSASLGHPSKSGKGFPKDHRFSATNSHAASSFGINCTFLAGQERSIFHFRYESVSPRVHESTLHQAYASQGFPPPPQEILN